jgi:hypothetical protein
LTATVLADPDLTAKPEKDSAIKTTEANMDKLKSKTDKILFLGNSITRHGPRADVGWSNNWGMAASAADKDYVHVLTRAIAKLTGKTPEIMIEGIVDFERHSDTYDPAARLQKAVAFRADTIIVALGENVPALDTEAAKANFNERLLNLLNTLKDAGNPTIVVRSCFWPNEVKDAILKQACAAVGGVFVDIGALGRDPSNFASAERSYAHAGVAHHPGDKGMQGIAAAILAALQSEATVQPTARPAIGAYYFDGWAGRNRHAGETNEPWAQNAPTHLCRRLLDEFPDREPIWGWRDDNPAIMERQIDLAADHGLAFFAFCWYWRDDKKAINRQAIKDTPYHTSMELYLKAKNLQRLKFCLLVANHQGSEIVGADNWRQAAEFWLPYLKHPQHLTVDGKPLLIIFNPAGADKNCLAAVQEVARKAGLPGIAIAGCGGGALEAGYTHRTSYNVRSAYAPGSGPAQRKYSELVAANRAVWKGSRQQPFLPIITSGWDRRPWEGPTGLGSDPSCYYPDRTPEQFADFLRDTLKWMDAHPDQATAERIALIYAWNEFGEGGYLAPTKGDPDGKYLRAIRSVLMPVE